jgi:5-oxopent-3-ene-1,2,5-tricarboxylate decarboxylase/2-hydroxyhepta-2,4-diene-1,7-dioate isomerase
MSSRLARGSVYGVALNFKGALAALGDAVHRDPYKKPPEAPVLYLKPRNTWILSGAPIPCPAGVPQLRMGGTLGVCIDRGAPGLIGGYAVVNDVSIPHASYYRPAIREQCRDGFCPIGPQLKPDALSDLASVDIRIYINGELRAENTTANLVRGVPDLIRDISEFMTLHTGDLLLAGQPDNAPLAAVGDRVRVEIAGLGSIENPVEAEPA